jgi:16S rRNA G966 N2-methylase RsmD
MPNLARNLDAEPRGTRPRVTDRPVDYSIPYKSREKGASRHYGFFPFFAKKPWPVIQEYINHYTSPGDLVCDPFSGSGVTAVESLVLGRRATATDINPIARFITRMTAVAPVDLEALRVAFEYVRSVAQEPIESLNSISEANLQSLLSTLDYPRNPIPLTVRRGGAETIDQLHTPRQLAGLTILRDAINQVHDECLRDLLRVGLCRTIRYANKTYDLPVAKEGKKRRSPYAGNSNFLRRFSYSLANEARFYEHPVWTAFEHSIKNVFEAKEETNRLIGERYNPTNFTLGDVPASRIHELTGEGTVDYCFTDPPYSNEIYFVDLSVLWAAWLGLEITDEIRHDELIEGGVDNKSREQFEREFAAAMESIAKALKQDRWFTLVYKHRDLSLWQNIVAACERCGLQYINSVWQDVRITSTRQIECPNINPKGDMYLNFRKMSRRKFETVYPKADVVDIPTRPNYLLKEVERLIVSYLGADITLITAGAIQQILDSRAFSQGNPSSLEQDIPKLVRQSPAFTTWQLNNETFWVLSSQTLIDLSLPAIDRARYYVFDWLREKGEATEGDVSTHLLTQFSNEPVIEIVASDVPALLRQVGREISHRRWQFDETRVTRYKQLRLFFQTANVDRLRQRIQDREVQEAALRPNYEGLASLYDSLHRANTDNSSFEAQWGRLLKILKLILQRMLDSFEDQIEKVLAFGEWAQHGVDLRNTSFEDTILQIVLRSEDRPLSLYKEIAEKAFSNLNDDGILMQFHLMTSSEWAHATDIARSREQQDALGISVLDRP